jgi:hypothetical protein
MNEYKLGDMVKVNIRTFNRTTNENGTRIVHGMITQLRMKSEIAYVEFLPIENTSNQWVSFGAMNK